MKIGFVKQALFCLALVISLGLSAAAASAGTMRLTMQDGTFVEVPFYWVEGGEIKFEISGGVAGVVRAQVKSIQEVITAKEFDPEVLLEAPRTAANAGQQKVLQDLIAAKSSAGPSADKLSSDEGLRLLKARGDIRPDAPQKHEKVVSPRFAVEGNFAEVVRSDNQGPMLLMRNVLSTRSDLKGQRFLLTLYDADGRVLQQKPCELLELKADRKTLKALDVRGHLYTVMASVKPDPKIKRYEITALQP